MTDDKDSSSEIDTGTQVTDLSSSEFSILEKNLIEFNNFSNFMINEIKESFNNEELTFFYGDVDQELDNDYFKISINNTNVILNKSTELLKMSWIVDEGGKRGNGYTREPDMPKGMERGHIKSIMEGAEDNSIEDSPLNIIPQTPVVNDPNIKEFENYRVKNCVGDKVITTIVGEESVRVEIPDKDIDVIYNPYSENEWGDEWWFKSEVE